jgi:hypothetical protein
MDGWIWMDIALGRREGREGGRKERRKGEGWKCVPYCTYALRKSLGWTA